MAMDRFRGRWCRREGERGTGLCGVEIGTMMDWDQVLEPDSKGTS